MGASQEVGGAALSPPVTTTPAWPGGGNAGRKATSARAGTSGAGHRAQRGPPAAASCGSTSSAHITPAAGPLYAGLGATAGVASAAGAPSGWGVTGPAQLDGGPTPTMPPADGECRLSPGRQPASRWGITASRSRTRLPSQCLHHSPGQGSSSSRPAGADGAGRRYGHHHLAGSGHAASADSAWRPPCRRRRPG